MTIDEMNLDDARQFVQRCKVRLDQDWSSAQIEYTASKIVETLPPLPGKLSRQERERNAKVATG